ncbi:MAG TPA: LuxR C-terminal-related transcriptional regulator [Chitinophagaceae bacterium]|jgi:DNA-binding NarL/FixJ family response regulator|nr:LuxR C-terminal-related transcriptional regulator [Chitinophagaceae bacterium]
MFTEKSALLEQIQSALQKESGKNLNGKDKVHPPSKYSNITSELNDKNNLYYIKNNESIKLLEQRIESLESQNDRLLYFIHFLYDNFPDLVRNIMPPGPEIEVKNTIGRALGPADNEKNDIPTLTRREEEVMQLMITGLCAKEIARKLFISETTVITHKKNLKEKFGAKNSVELTSKAFSILLKQNESKL